MNRSRFVLGSALLTLMIAGGCTSYYRIQDTTDQKVYYTTKYKQHADGAVEFKDSVTKQEMNLKSVGIQQLDKGQWEDDMERIETGKAPAN